MKSSVVLRRLIFAPVAFALFPSFVFAHPGHAGGHGDGLTWDFAGSLVHFLTSPYHLLSAVAAGAVVALGFAFLRRGRAKRKE